MALENFKATIWSDAVQANLDASLVAGALVNTSFEGELGRGKTIKINKIGALAVTEYDGTTPLSPETITSTAVDLVVDQAQAVAFKLDDVDAAQATPALMASATAEAGRAMANKIDEYVIGVMGNAAYALSPAAINGTTVTAYSILSDLAVRLDNQSVPATDRFVICSPAFAAQLALDVRLNRATAAGDAVAASHLVGEAAGFRVYKSVHVATDTVIAGHTVGCAFAQQVNKTEAVRSADFFADVVRTLAVYGAKVIRTEVFAKVAWSLD